MRRSITGAHEHLVSRLRIVAQVHVGVFVRETAEFQPSNKIVCRHVYVDVVFDSNAQTTSTHQRIRECKKQPTTTHQHFGAGVRSAPAHTPAF